MVRVAIVEDEALVALDLRTRLEAFGHEIVGVAPSYEAALRLADASTPDVMLMDIRLGNGPDGIEAARAIRAQRDVPVLFLTAHSDDETLRRAWETAPFGYILKPFSDRQLQVALQLAIEKHRVEGELKRVASELQEALDHARTLKGLLPLCSFCKKVRNDVGYWERVDVYIQSHSDAVVSHGLCPECAAEHYPEFFPENASSEPDADS